MLAQLHEQREQQQQQQPQQPQVLLRDADGSETALNSSPSIIFQLRDPRDMALADKPEPTLSAPTSQQEFKSLIMETVQPHLDNQMSIQMKMLEQMQQMQQQQQPYQNQQQQQMAALI